MLECFVRMLPRGRTGRMGYCSGVDSVYHSGRLQHVHDGVVEAL